MGKNTNINYKKKPKEVIKKEQAQKEKEQELKIQAHLKLDVIEQNKKEKEREAKEKKAKDKKKKAKKKAKDKKTKDVKGEPSKDDVEEEDDDDEYNIEKIKSEFDSDSEEEDHDDDDEVVDEGSRIKVKFNDDSVPHLEEDDDDEEYVPYDQIRDGHVVFDQEDDDDGGQDVSNMLDTKLLRETLPMHIKDRFHTGQYTPHLFRVKDKAGNLLRDNLSIAAATNPSDFTPFVSQLMNPAPVYPSYFPPNFANMAVEGTAASFEPLVKQPNSITLAPIGRRAFPLMVNIQISPLWFEELRPPINTSLRHLLTSEKMPVDVVDRLCQEVESDVPALDKSLVPVRRDTDQLRGYGNTMVMVRTKLLLIATGPNMNVFSGITIGRGKRKLPTKYDHKWHALIRYDKQQQPILDIKLVQYSLRLYLVYFRTTYSLFFFYLHVFGDKYRNFSLEEIKKATFRQKIMDATVPRTSMGLANVLLEDGTLMSFNFISPVDESAVDGHGDSLRIIHSFAPDYPSFKCPAWAMLARQPIVGNSQYILSPSELVELQLDPVTGVPRTRVLLRAETYGPLTGIYSDANYFTFVTTTKRAMMFDNRTFDRPLLVWSFVKPLEGPVTIHVPIIEYLSNIKLLLVKSNLTGLVYVLQYRMDVFPRPLQIAPIHKMSTINMATSTNTSSKRPFSMSYRHHATIQNFLDRPFTHLINGDEPANLYSTRLPVACGAPFMCMPVYGSEKHSITLPFPPFPEEPLTGLVYIQTNNNFFTLLQMSRIGDVTSTRYSLKYKHDPLDGQDKFDRHSHRKIQASIYRTPLQIEFLRRFIEQRNYTNYCDVVREFGSTIMLRQMPKYLNMRSSLPFKLEQFENHPNKLFSAIIELLKLSGPMTMGDIMERLGEHFTEEQIKNTLTRHSRPGTLNTTAQKHHSTLGLYHIKLKPHATLTKLDELVVGIDDPLIELNTNVYSHQQHFFGDVDELVGNKVLVQKAQRVHQFNRLSKHEIEVYQVNETLYTKPQLERYLTREAKLEEQRVKIAEHKKKMELMTGKRQRAKKPVVNRTFKVQTAPFEPDAWYQEWINDAHKYEEDHDDEHNISTMLPPTSLPTTTGKANRDAFRMPMSQTTMSQPVYSRRYNDDDDDDDLYGGGDSSDD
ncbi:hypothetical protein SAMD00019534_102600 [Acytostelium subglobosum LB1]|uniref:hypothetical protein n=1 Tax=Acytostelium subglobosum LB1 TaxID=1410327 RepID=UPI000644DD6A|nr:hypothetical protein SAMD00019534_102600 [Acytostelium subglobosum LB1]GAM27085.1 hypothetical protein SAMD00019534_102600 [Acytostelium subglobosum LB1]|eukprot:XP_012749965.1 hypothetical protein SAMD00019534_102600 [Acytostelium subglobosum LB1]